MQTNTTRQLLFKASPEDAARMAMLPVTGRRLRPAALPWEERPRSPFLPTQDERELLVREVSSLPQRVFLYWNRDRPYRAELVRAAQVGGRGQVLRPASVARRLRVGSMALPLRELEAQGATAAETTFRSRRAAASALAPTPSLTSALSPAPPTQPSRRSRRRSR